MAMAGNQRAYAYYRFSTAEQEDGRSLQRQEAGAKAYCQRRGLRIERTFVDAGVSAWEGANVKGGELGVFLAMLRDGRIPKGSVLVVENFDRLYRGSPLEGNALTHEILRAGVEIVTTSPEGRHTLDNVGDPGVWIPMAVAQALASAESKKKSIRLRDAREAERAEARTPGGKKMTRNGPAWLKLAGDRKGWVPVPKKVALVRRVFALAMEQGMGVTRIAAEMAKECPEGFTNRGWQPMCIAKLLRSRSVLGEFQPHVGTCARRGGKKSTRRPDGDPVAGYYPAVIDEATFYKVQAALDARRSGGGPTTGTPNLFAGVLYNAIDGHRMVVNSSHGHKVLSSAGAVRKAPGSDGSVISYEFFERATLSQLRELKASDVLGTAADAAADRVSVASGKLVALGRKVADAQRRAAEAVDAEEAAVFHDLLATYGREKARLVHEHEAAKAAAACQEGDNVGEFVSLVKLLDEAKPEERDSLRARVRSALRRVVSGMGLVLASRGDARLAFLQVWFTAGGKPREYVLYYHRGRRGRPSAWCVDTWRSQLKGKNVLDLRSRGTGEVIRDMLTSDAFGRWAAAMEAEAKPEGAKLVWAEEL
jgi:DNA invertase Pin-like site-specific DNA recombinase